MNELIHSPRTHYRLHLVVGAHSARHIRRIVRAHLRLWGLRELTDAAELAVTELVANVVRHVPGRRCTIVLRRRGDALRIEVSDDFAGLPRVRDADVLDEGGRGLAMVGLVSRAWGIERDAHAPGKTVWCEIGGEEADSAE
ncbi:ATP-binding protein [Streptantibioticus parmotrematis]|uniref:ATP-binding protein n=1 Tax=Streptantibioticus parmotrematis TaxID=2873249 RepID=UPI0027DFD040|nr:ATP-binding protein [Streptantibioticus parmotrematis]